MSLKISTPTAMNIPQRFTKIIHPLSPPPAGDIPRTCSVKGKVGGFSPAGGGLRGWKKKEIRLLIFTPTSYT